MGKQKPIDFKFADPVNDPKALEGYIDENGVKYKIDRIKFMSSESIDNALWNSGVYNKENQEDRWNFAMSESDASAGSGKMDYVCTANFERGRYQKVLNEIGDVSEIASNELYITNTKSGYYAHNDHNFGNFLWGAGMNALGFREYTARLGAHIFALKKEGELDSSDDQLSIKLGFEWRK